MITQKELKKLLHYNPETGIFKWIVNRGRARKGNAANRAGDYGGIDIYVNGKSNKSHRLAWLYMTGKWPKEQIDHINHVRDDNRWVNLREVTHKENQMNRKLSKNNTSRVQGVVWHKRNKRWQAQIQVNKKTVYLGMYVDKFEAICARKSANNRYSFHENHGK